MADDTLERFRETGWRVRCENGVRRGSIQLVGRSAKGAVIGWADARREGHALAA